MSRQKGKYTMKKKRIRFVTTAVILSAAAAMNGCQNRAESTNIPEIPERDRAVLPDDPRYKYTYPITEVLDDEAFDRYLDDDGTLFQKVQAYYKSLSGSEAFTFVPFAANPLELVNIQIPEHCVCNYGTEWEEDSYYEIEGEPAVAAEAVQVSASALDLFPIEIEEGRGFEASDCGYLQDRTIPVILGAACRDTFNVGDTFEGYYILEKFTFEVIGIAGSGSAFYRKASSSPAAYDSFIIMPLAGITEDTPLSRRILLQEVCGFITAESGREETLAQIQKYLADAGLPDWQDAIVINAEALR